MLHAVITKTFGGLSAKYYVRNFLFGLIFPIAIYFLRGSTETQISGIMFFFLVINTILYPYSRFVYENVIRFIVGNNIFLVNVFLMLIVKLITMALYWVFAVVIAPVGLIYLYFQHSRVDGNPPLFRGSEK
jgi:hypothetical protein